MKKLILISLLTCALNSVALEELKDPLKQFKMETHSSEILKVFFAINGEAQFVAYKVMWKGQEIIITDMFCKVPKNVGDNLSFMSQSMKIPNMANAGVNGRKSVLQFIAVPEIDVNQMMKNNPVVKKKQPKEAVRITIDSTKKKIDADDYVYCRKETCNRLVKKTVSKCPECGTVTKTK